MLKWRVTPYSELLRPCIYIHYCVYCRLSEGSVLHGDSEDPASFCALVQACKHGLRSWGGGGGFVKEYVVPQPEPSSPPQSVRCFQIHGSNSDLFSESGEVHQCRPSAPPPPLWDESVHPRVEAAGVKNCLRISSVSDTCRMDRWICVASANNVDVAPKPLRRKRVPVGEGWGGRSGIWLGSPPGCLTMKVFWACLSRVTTRWRDCTSHMALERLGIPQEGLEYVARRGRGMSGIPSLWGSSETVRSFLLNSHTHTWGDKDWPSKTSGSGLK